MILAALLVQAVWLSRRLRRLETLINDALTELRATDLAVRTRLDEQLVDDTVRRFEAQWAAEEEEEP